MHIWVDADACPGPVKEILFRAAERTGTPVTLVANQPLRTPRSELVRAVQVPGGFDVADDHIAGELAPGDLVITADIPLAAAAVEAGALALSPRGQLFDADNVRERLVMRDLMDQLRGSGIDTGGPRAYSSRDRQAFANQLDRLLASRT